MNHIPEEELRRLCEQVDGEYSLFLSDPQSGESLSIHAQQQFPSASTIKIPLLALLLKDGQEGRLDLNTPVPVPEENRVGGSGILQSLGRYFDLNLFDCAVLMMVLSDNVATNQVIDAVGMDRANAFFAENGWTATRLNRKMCIKGEDNYTSTADLADMMERIRTGTMINKEISDQILQILAGHRLGRFRLGVPAIKRTDPHKPLEAVPEGSVIVASKGGTRLGCIHESAILLLPKGRSLVLVMMTKGNGSHNERVLARVAEAVYQALA